MDATVILKPIILVLFFITLVKLEDFDPKIESTIEVLQNFSKDKQIDVPLILKEPENQTVYEGTNVTFSCFIVGVVDVTWIKRGKNVTYLRVNASNSYELNLKLVTLDDAGNYTCLVTNKAGSKAASGNLFVLPLPVIPWLEYALYGGLALVIVGLIAFYFIKKYKLLEKKVILLKRKVVVEQNTDESGELKAPTVTIITESTYLRESDYNESLNNRVEAPIDPEWEFPRENLELLEVLGGGNFGVVNLAVADGLIEPGQKDTVAVKMLTDNWGELELKSFVSEIELMKLMAKHKHPNIIELLGCSTSRGEVLAIVEFAKYGCLKSLLEKEYASKNYIFFGGSKVVNDIMQFAHDIASGMEYLASQKFVHRDLAARNILVCENRVAKIADFGLSRSYDGSDYYSLKHGGQFPLKWMAPETFAQKKCLFNSKSDVWSYGILLWELITFGKEPYPNLPLDLAVFKFFFQEERRMDKPPNCPDEIYELMRQCWDSDPSKRPTFEEIILSIENFQDQFVKSPNKEYKR